MVFRWGRTRPGQDELVECDLEGDDVDAVTSVK